MEVICYLLKLLVKHAAKVYSDLPEEPLKAKPKNRKERFLDALPSYFQPPNLFNRSN